MEDDMRKFLIVPLIILAAALVRPEASGSGPGGGGQVTLKPIQRTMTRVTPPKTAASKMDRPGPVRSPDPYYTIKVGDAEIYRDAKDPSLAYYKPVIRLARRAGTPLAEGVGPLASSLDGFRFQYYKFESGGTPKWASIQIVVALDRPQDATLEAVQAKWKGITRLVPLPLKIDGTTGTRMTLPYPPRAVSFSESGPAGAEGENRWQFLSTNTHPTPPDLMTDANNSALNEAKAKDYASLITSDLGDMPSFQPVLEVRAVFPGWSGATPLAKTLTMFKPAAGLRLTPAGGSGTATPPAAPPRTAVATRTMMTAQKTAAGPSPAPAPAPAPPAGQAGSTAQKPALRTIRPVSRAALRPDLIKVFGELKPREDIDYAYSETQELVTRIPISYPKGKTADYDYYFLSDSGRFGGPYFEPSAAPNRPVRAEPPQGFSGLWYESHSFGKRLVWPAPKELRLRWEVESGLRPSCRFAMTTDAQGKPTGHITYDLYPALSARELQAAVEALKARTGEAVDVLPFPDLLDANQIVLASGNPALQPLIAARRISLTPLSPARYDDAWFRMTVDIPVDDWSAFTLFMRTGDLGTWDVGIKTGASSGMAERATFRLMGDLLETMGGPVSASLKTLDQATGGYEVVLNNYGLDPLSVGGVRFTGEGGGRDACDVWLDDGKAGLAGIGSASSFDQQNGMSGAVTATVKAAASPAVKTFLDAGKFPSLVATLAPDMVGPSAAPDAAGGTDPDIKFSFLRSLCYQFIGSSEIIQVPVAPAELSQWADYAGGLAVLRFQGYVYTKELDLAARNTVEMRRLPHEGAYAFAGKPGDADVLEIRTVFTRKDGTVVYLPAAPEGETKWLTGDISGVILDMTQAQPTKK
jgi:hypothetical protein